MNLKNPLKDSHFKYLLLVMVSIASGFFGGWVGGQNSGLSLNDRSGTTQKIVSSESELINQIAEEVGSAVVSITVTSEQVDRGFFGFGEVFDTQSAGTGFIISEDGIVLTNRHVIPKNATSVSVTLADGTELQDVEVVGRTNDNDPLDIAFLKIKDTKGKKLMTAKIGDSSKVKVGDKVIAIGNALGQFQNTVTAGIISGYGRSIMARGETGGETLQNLFQTDTAINQGNSGGPLVNLSGEVIGINTAVAGNAENIGFSIPVNDVRGMIKSVLKRGELLRPYLGIRYVSITDDYAFQFNLDTKRGAYILPSSGGIKSILSGSPAEKAGLKEKDIITKIDGAKIDETNSLTSLLGQHDVGKSVELTIIRDSNEKKISVTLEAAPKD